MLSVLLLSSHASAPLHPALPPLLVRVPLKSLKTECRDAVGLALPHALACVGTHAFVHETSFARRESAERKSQAGRGECANGWQRSAERERPARRGVCPTVGKTSAEHERPARRGVCANALCVQRNVCANPLWLVFTRRWHLPTCGAGKCESASE